MNRPTFYFPKGGMCRSCKHRDADCSILLFHKMPVIERKGREVVVKCTEFKRP